MNRSANLDVVLLLIGAHSILLGLVMMTVPGTVLGLARWPDPGHLFFPTQCGLFLAILGVLYVVGRWHRPFAWTVVGTKAVALIFLLVTFATGLAPSIVAWQALADGTMGAVVLILLRREARFASE